MRQIFEKELNKIIKEKESLFNFNINKTGIYGIEITASAKSWWQNLINLRSFFKDDDLTLKIDEIEIPKRGLKQKRLFDGEAAFNGNNLKGKKKTNLFLIKLNKGTHTLTFLADQKPKIHSIRVYQSSTISKEKALGQIEENKEKTFQHSAEYWNVRYLPKDNYPIEDGNRRQWLTIILVNIALKFLKITASAKQGRSFFFFKRDDADLKLIINNQIQKNQEPKSHKSWYWCGQTLKGKEKTFEKGLSLPPAIHYIEFWADRSPEVKEIKIGIEKISSLPKAKIIWKKINLREKPKTNSKSLAILEKEKIVEILERAVRGERPKNEKGDYLLSDRWHKVRYKRQEGYIYSEALEIEGESREEIKKVIIEKSGALKEDRCLMLAIAWRESKFFPYTISDIGAQGIFQLRKEAIEDVNRNFKKNFNLENRFNIYENVEAGILYFKLLEERYKEKDYFLERCLAAYNRGPKKIKPNQRFVFGEQPLKVQKYIRDIINYRKDCEKKNLYQGKISLNLLLFVVFFLLILVGFFLTNISFRSSYSLPENYKNCQVLKQVFADLDNDGQKEKIVAITDNPNSTFSSTKILLIRKNNSSLEFPEEENQLQWFKVGDFNKNGKKDIAVLFGYSGSAGWANFYLDEFFNNHFKKLLTIEEMGSKISFQDLDGDGIPEILHSYYIEKWGKKQLEIYKWDKNRKKYFKINADKITNVLIKDEKN